MRGPDGSGLFCKRVAEQGAGLMRGGPGIRLVGPVKVEVKGARNRLQRERTHAQQKNYSRLAILFSLPRKLMEE